MKKLSPLSMGGLLLCALLQFVFSSAALAQSTKSGVTIRVTVNGVSTDFVEGNCGFGSAAFGGIPNFDLCAPAEWAHDINGQDSLVCDSIPVGSLTGKIGLVRRGACPAPNATAGNFVAKAWNAQRAGAEAVLIANHYATAGQVGCTVQNITGTDPNVTVPVFFLSRTMAEFIDAAINSGQPVEVCIHPPNVFMVSNFFPVQNIQTPESQIATDTFGFSASLTNVRGSDLTNVVVTAKVLEAGGNELYSTSLSIPLLTGDVVDSFFVVPGQYIPDLPIGDYVLVYTTESDAVGDIDFKHETRAAFKVTDNLFAKDDGPTGGLRPGTLPDAGWGIGNLYILTSGALDQYEVNTVEFAHAVNTGETPITDINADMFLFRVNDDVVADWNLFEGTDFLSPSFEWLGTGSYQAPANAANYQLQQVEMIDLNSAEAGVAVQPGSTYVLAAFYPDSSKTAFNAFDQDVEVAGPEGINTLTYSTQWFLGGFSSGCCGVLRMYVDLVVTSDVEPLPDSYMKVFPNPVKDVLNLGLSLEKPTDITVTIAELSGRTIRIEDKFGMTNETLTYQLPQLASGTYLARIATKEGTLTKKFVVQK